jgi:hypothetical protein
MTPSWFLAVISIFSKTIKFQILVQKQTYNNHLLLQTVEEISKNLTFEIFEIKK